jgi:hypothetical protein
VDATGRLIGIPTQGSQLDCRPGDTNFDGQIDAADVGCIPVGGSIGQLRPINLAHGVLADAGFVQEETGPVESPQTPTPTFGDLMTPGEYATVVAARAALPPTLEAGSSHKVDEPPPGGVMPTPGVDEDYCLTSPLYPVGTRITVAQQIVFYQEEASRVSLYDDNPSLEPHGLIPAGTVVEISGPFVEKGVCDYWPVRYHVPAGYVVEDRYVDERDLRQTD